MASVVSGCSMRTAFTAAQRRHIRRASRVPEPEPGDDELNIVPFLDVVVNLIMFLLLTSTAILAAREVHAQLPTHGPPTEGAEFRPTVLVGERGVWVSSAAGTYAPGCQAAAGADEPTVPLVGGSPDWLALRTCAETLAAQHPDAHRATLTAEPGVALQDVIHAMDALKGGGRLFHDVDIAATLR
ncbi:MAG: hypothetical protein CMN30_08085 [Sandaracinus sp.]|nr:hypothetical protein [Sandaracinus sp.]